MKLPFALLHRLSWLNLPGAILLALLQRTPVLRLASAAGERLAAPAWGAVARTASVTLASLGSVHALAGATQWSFSRPSPISAVSGSVFAPLAFTVVGAQTPPGSFLVTGLPPGITALGANANGVINASTGILSGTPTTPGTYVVNITAWEFANRAGDFIGPERLTINVTAGLAVAPTFLQQPVGQTVAVGASVTFTASATGIPAPTYQWRRNNVAIAGATGSSLTLSNVQLADTADFTVVVSNSAGSLASDVATLLVTASGAGSRLVNLSILTSISPAGDSFTMGYVVGGSGTSGTKPILIRAAGPTLGAAPFNLSGALADPRLETFVGTAKTGENDNWGGTATLSTAFSAVGAFAYFSPTSLDAAVLGNLAAGDNSVRISANGTGTGQVIAELYDSTPAAAMTATTPRLVNVSVLKALGAGLTAGFVIDGVGAKRVLIRAIGPTIGAAPFNVAGAVADPRLQLFSGATAIGTNDNWGGGAELAAAFNQVGAFVLPAASRDAALLATLQPGAYTVQVSGVGGTTGVALVEIYEVP